MFLNYLEGDLNEEFIAMSHADKNPITIFTDVNLLNHIDQVGGIHFYRYCFGNGKVFKEQSKMVTWLVLRTQIDPSNLSVQVHLDAIQHFFILDLSYIWYQEKL